MGKVHECRLRFEIAPRAGGVVHPNYQAAFGVLATGKGKLEKTEWSPTIAG